MAEMPVLTDYVELIITLFGLFKQYRREQHDAKVGRPFTYAEEMFIIFFLIVLCTGCAIMQFRQIQAFKAQWRWLDKHPEMVAMLGGGTPSHHDSPALQGAVCGGAGICLVHRPVCA